MIKTKKPVFFVVFFLILAFSASVYFGVDYWYGDLQDIYIKGVDDIRLGVDIQGGVDVTFKPSADAEGNAVDASDGDLDAALEIIKLRLLSNNISDSETYIDYDNDRIIVRFPWKSGETDFDPETAVNELGETAMLYFIEGTEYDLDKLVFSGSGVADAYVTGETDQTTGVPTYKVGIELNPEATKAFGEATSRLASSSGSISIWMDDVNISSPQVNEAITSGKCVIESPSFASDFNECKSLADKIAAGALPFSLDRESFRTISPTMGVGSLNVMIISGIIAYIFIALYLIVLYRLPGFVASIALLGQISGTLAAISGWFGFEASSTLTIPGIAGIILAIGMGVDANIITFERIKEELASGKTLDSSLKAGYSRAFSAILDGNVSSLIVSFVLMGAFGVPTSFFAKIFNKIFFMFGTTTEGTIYSFGFTLVAGVILNFLMGVLATRFMLFSLSRFKVFQNKKLYGGANNG